MPGGHIKKCPLLPPLDGRDARVSLDGAANRPPVGIEVGAIAAHQDGEDRDAALAALPDFICLETMMKATPAEEGGERFIYVQASDESIDAQGERVLCKALRDSADTFMRYGSLDIDHIVLRGPRSGIPNYMAYEIGVPVDVRFEADRTFVKAQLYRGDHAGVENAEMVWKSLTRQSPPARWYASVGGATGSKAIQVDPVTKASVPVIKSVRWTNLALSRTPVNQSVPTATAMPMGVFAKSFDGFVVEKSEGLTAGYGTDMATLEGGGALRGQSLDHKIHSYFDFAERLAGDVRKGLVTPSETEMATHAAKVFGLGHAQATAWTSRFLADLSDALQGNPHV